MPQKIPKKYARQINRTIKLMEQREREESEHSTVHRATNIGIISPKSFRSFEPAYKQFADEYKQKYYDAHPEVYQ